MYVPKEDPVTMALLPFYHCFGMLVVLAGGLYKGLKIVIVPGFEPAGFLKTIQDYKVCRLICMYATILCFFFLRILIVHSCAIYND